MRIWHKDLIEYLPKAQLTGQWRELSAIAGNIMKTADKGKPFNQPLVNKALNYPITHFTSYANKIYNEMLKRGYKPKKDIYKKVTEEILDYKNLFSNSNNSILFFDWHNDRYLIQCFYNIQEKYDSKLFPKSNYFQIYTVLKDRNLI